MEEMSLSQMISALDGAAGRLIVASQNNPEVNEAREMILKVSLSLGEYNFDMKDQ